MDSDTNNLEPLHSSTETSNLMSWFGKQRGGLKVVLAVFLGILWNLVVLISLPKLPTLLQFLLTLIALGLGAVVPIFVPSSTLERRLRLAGVLVPVVASWLLMGGLEHVLVALALTLIGLAFEIVGQRFNEECHRRLRHADLASMAVEALKASNKERPRLIAHACHDLHQPVHTLDMLLDSLEVDAPREVMGARLREVRVTVQSLSDMITDMLDLARLEEGHYAIELQPVSVWHVLREADQTYGWLARRKGLEWVISPSRVWVLCDPGMLRRVINNLVSNAIKYTYKGSVGVSCTTENGVVILKVTDTGIGIPKDKISMAFVDYVRLEGSHHEAGHGIGLSVVKRMLDLLGNRLRVESTVGIGSRFIIELPQVQSQTESVVDQSVDPSNTKPWHGVLIVYVENDDQMRHSTAEMLTSWGATVVASPSAALALADPALQSHPPALVISDMHLGLHIDGLGVIAEFRKKYPQPLLPAILLTGDVQPGLQDIARGLDIRVGYKPLRPAKLRELISSALTGQLITVPMPLGPQM